MKERIDVKKLSIYFYHIVQLIYEYQIDSLFKIEFCAFIITMNEFIGIQLNGAKNNLINRFLLNFHYYFLSNYSDFIYINESIKILEDNHYVIIHNDKITILNKIDLIDSMNFTYSKELKETLKEIMSMSVDSFKEEVINNV